MKKENIEDYKISLVYYDLEENIAIETVFASKEGDYYRVKNVPFFAPNIAYNDLIEVDIEDNILYFENLIEPSGHSTIQVTIYSDENLKKFTDIIESLKCDWEGSHLSNYLSIDIPRNIDYSNVKKELEDGFNDGIWDYKEACLSDKHRMNLKS